MSTHADEVESLVDKEYEHGFVTDIDSDTIAPGLNEEVIAFISNKKNDTPNDSENKDNYFKFKICFELRL